MRCEPIRRKTKVGNNNMSAKNKRKTKQTDFLRILLVLLIGIAAFAGISDAMIPSAVSGWEGEPISVGAFCDLKCLDETGEHGVCRTTGATANLFGIIPVKKIDVSTYRDIRVLPGGMPFGVKMFTKGILVVGISDVESEKGTFSPAHEAGIRVKDIICKINGKEINSAEELTEIVEKSGGVPLKVTLLRDGKELTVTLQPVRHKTEQTYKAGVWIRDSTAGIGTVTFILPEDGSFGGLGHGICDVDTGDLMPLLRGSVMDVTISGVIPGTPGTPGELKGYFNSHKTGTMLKNSAAGVYGVLSQIPQTPFTQIPIALKDEIHEGNATVLCTLDENGIGSYDIQISNINRSGGDLKGFVITVTDPVLLGKTGGIVQGMSGSPVLQDGKLIGAVTHVLINDPARGYGIFIENMLSQLPA